MTSSGILVILAVEHADAHGVAAIFTDFLCATEAGEIAAKDYDMGFG
jgi:hypothetical protein